MRLGLLPAKRGIVLSIFIGMAAVGSFGIYLLSQQSQQSLQNGARPTAEEHTGVDGDEAASLPGEPGSARGATADTPLWTVLDEASLPELPPFPRDWSAAGRVLVRVDATLGAAPNWRVGDVLSIPLPQLGVTYRPEIGAVDDGLGRSRSATGKIVGEDGRHRRFVVTVGAEGGAFAFIDTPEGTYELVAWRNVGWLLPTASMMAGVDPDEPDYVLRDTDRS